MKWNTPTQTLCPLVSEIFCWQEWTHADLGCLVIKLTIPSSGWWLELTSQNKAVSCLPGCCHTGRGCSDTWPSRTRPTGAAPSQTAADSISSADSRIIKEARSVPSETHLGSGPAQQSKRKLAEGRDHQVHSHSPPLSGLLFWPLVSFHSVRHILWSWSCLVLHPLQLKDGQTSLKAVHVGRRVARTLLRFQVGVSCSFLVQQEALWKKTNSMHRIHWHNSHFLSSSIPEVWAQILNLLPHHQTLAHYRNIYLT